MNKKIKLIIVDDHPIVLNGLQMMLSNRDDIEISGTYSTGHDLMKGLLTKAADILILDIKLPDIPGDELIAQVLAKYPEINVLVLTYLDNFYYIKTMIKQGALGYVLKTCGKKILLDAIYAVAKGEEYIQDQVKDTLVHHALSSKKDLNSDILLTKREKDVLQLIASNYNSQQIADKLFISKRTVETHRANLLLKIKVKNAPALVKKAMQLNLIN